MNLGIFAGRIGRDAETRYTDSGKAVTNFSLAVDVGFGDNKSTLWVDCSAWGDRYEKLAAYLLKGTALTAQGRVNLRLFQKRDGSTGASLTLDVQEITLQGRRNGEDGERGEERQSSSTPAATSRPAPSSTAPAATRAPARPATRPSSSTRAPAPAGDGGLPFDDDIPF